MPTAASSAAIRASAPSMAAAWRDVTWLGLGLALGLWLGLWLGLGLGLGLERLVIIDGKAQA